VGRKVKRDLPSAEAAEKAAALLGCVREYGRYSPVAARKFLKAAIRVLEEDGVRDPLAHIRGLYERKAGCRKAV